MMQYVLNNPKGKTFNSEKIIIVHRATLHLVTTVTTGGMKPGAATRTSDTEISLGTIHFPPRNHKATV
jgi:hypothetical protein